METKIEHMDSKFHLVQKSILMIDDSLDTLSLGRMVLESDGFKVFTASSGKQGLEALSQIDEPDLVLLDMQMGDMSGLDFLKKLENQAPEIFKDVPMVFYTGCDQVPKSKAKGMIRKTGGIDKFLESIHSFLEVKNSPVFTQQ